MELTRDVILHGTAWSKAADNLSEIFKTRPHYMLFMLSIAIGIMYDKRIEALEENGEDPKSIGRNVLLIMITENLTLCSRLQFCRLLPRNLQKKND